MNDFVDYYDVLQVQSTADPDVVQAAYRRLARRYHPDNNDSPEATELMRQLNSAYETLSDPEKRTEYDIQRARHKSELDVETTSDKTHSGGALQTSVPEIWNQRPKTASKSRIWIISGALAIVLVGVIAGIFFLTSGDKSDQVVVIGKSLELHASPPEIVEKVEFRDTTGANRVIRPRASNRQLAVIKLVVVNRTALITSIVIDGDAAKLGDRRGERIKALDPFASSKAADVAGPSQDLYSPFLWGEVELDRNFQVEGHIVFDVPKGLILGSLFWDEVDAIVADYVDYTRRRL